MKKLLFPFVMFSILISNNCQKVKQKERDVLYQISTINALFDGIYDGTTSFKEIKKHGDFIIGTFHGLDGELLGFDNQFYQVKADGKVYPVNDEMKTPFAVVTFFDEDKTFKINTPMDLKKLKSELLSQMESENIFYAIKLDGTFSYIKTRSVPAQKRPYPKLMDLLKNQPIFEFKNVKGTIVGFWTPKYISEINVSGFHFHFITADKSGGGHLLDMELKEAKIAMDDTPDFFMRLPEDKNFRNADFEKREDQIKAGEEDKK